MNKLIVVFIITITFFNCDGIKNKNETLKESITKFKNSIMRN